MIGLLTLYVVFSWQELFHKLKAQGLEPTVETFNSAFVTMTYCSMADNYNAAVFISSLLSEMYASGLGKCVCLHKVLLCIYNTVPAYGHP